MAEHVRYLIPREGLLVRDIITREPLPEEGAWKPWTGIEGRHWRRCVRFGDCHIGNPPKPKKEETETHHKMSRKDKDKDKEK